LLVAGSYVGQTSQQLHALAKACPEIDQIELGVPRLMDPETRDAEIARCRRLIDGRMRIGGSAVLFTSRELVRAARTLSDLDVGAQVSAAIVELVSTLTIRPAWLIAKGGITSSDIATKALGIVRAMVLGQALPGVPVWSCGPECKWPGLSYVVFPGNVGGMDALTQIVGNLTSDGTDRTDAVA
jgi:uncharacterized protein YgbK (DUF1537 family)